MGHPNSVGREENDIESTGEPPAYQMTETVPSGKGWMQWSHTNVWADGALVATYDTAGLHFYFNDPLGTRRVQTDAAGYIEQNCQSLPYGDALQCPLADPTEHHFTGKERDTETGLDYFGARYYNSAFGRWMSPDWSAKEEPVPYGKLENPQTLNLYAYYLDSPLGGVDSDGHCCEVAKGIWDGGVDTVKGLAVGTWQLLSVASGDTDAGDAIYNSLKTIAGDGYYMARHANESATSFKAGWALTPTREKASTITQITLGVGLALVGDPEEGAAKGIGGTGAVGESWLARTFGGKSQAFFSTSLGGRFMDQFAKGIGYESKVGYATLTKSIASQIAKDAELVKTGQLSGVEWHFFRSPLTGRVGPSTPLMNALKNAKIPVVIH